MSILASIEYFVQLHFGDFFSSIEAFYLKDILILIQGILEPGHNSISSIARDPLNNVAHTTLTRFVNGHPDFWNNLEKLIQKVILSTSSDKMILVVDDTQLARRSKKIPFTTLTYDHNQKRYCQAQVLLTVGRVSDGFFPLEMMFSNSKEGPTKIEGSESLSSGKLGEISYSRLRTLSPECPTTRTLFVISQRKS